MAKPFHASIRGSGIVKSTAGNESSGISARIVADGLCLEVLGFFSAEKPVFQVSLSSSPDAVPKWVRLFGKHDL